MDGFVAYRVYKEALEQYGKQPPEFDALTIEEKAAWACVEEEGAF